MAIIHELLYKAKDYTKINFTTYTEILTDYLFQVYTTDTNVNCKIDMGNFMMPIETTIPCGLVMSEIITNSLKYAFPDTFSCKEISGEPCTIYLTLKRKGSDYLLIVADNGIGMAEGNDVSISHTLGRFLIRFIVEHQLQGSIEINTTGGTVYSIRFPVPAVKGNHFDE